MESQPLAAMQIGEKVSFSKTVGETDVYMFAGITGDFAPNHVNGEYMRKTAYGKRMAHGVLSIGFASTAATMMVDKIRSSGLGAVSYGYDRIRFVRPIYLGDTVTVEYTIAEIDHENAKTTAKIEVFNQNNELCTVGQHILKFIKIDN
jgi:acyl dehydratase